MKNLQLPGGKAYNGALLKEPQAWKKKVGREFLWASKVLQSTCIYWGIFKATHIAPGVTDGQKIMEQTLSFHKSR